MRPYFEIIDLSVGFRTLEGENKVLNIEHFAIERGESYGIVGESGAGKTVLALTLLGLLPKSIGIIHSGEIWFNGENLLDKTEKEMFRYYRGVRIAMIFQDPMSTLNPVFNVGQQIGRILQARQGLKDKALRERTKELLEMVRLPDINSLINKYPHELSGGQRQRVIIAMALSCGAEFLIADEPTRNLDVTIQAGILKLIGDLQKELNISVLFIANNVSLVNVFCDKAGILYKGKLVEDGRSDSVIRQARHPYTQTLISAIPRDKSEKLKFAGLKLKPTFKKGCPFYSHCIYGEEQCTQDEPMLEPVKGGQRVACFLAHKGRL